MHLTPPQFHPSILANLQIDKNQSSRWQQMASIDDESFEDHIAKTKPDDRELTSAGTLKLARQLANKKIVESTPSPCEDDVVGVHGIGAFVGKKQFQY